jgi:hypothetical protein
MTALTGNHASKRRHVQLSSSVATASIGAVAATAAAVTASMDLIYEILSWLPVK